MSKLRKYFGKGCAVVSGVVGSAGLALAEPSLTVPAIDTSIVFDAGNAVMVILAIVVAIGLGFRLIKKA